MNSFAEYKTDKGITQQRCLFNSMKPKSNYSYNNKLASKMAHCGKKIKWGTTNVVIGKRIGKGAFGQVYEATKQGTNERLAVKILANDPIVQSEFKNSSNLKHSGIVGIYDLLHDSGAALILMELCDSDLSNRLLEKKKLQNDEIYSIMVDTASGLRYMQALNVVHRDLKPENMLIKEGRIKISDFGVSKRDEATLKTNVGTPCYQAPEVSNGSGNYTGKCDVFSLGIILYQMCYGMKPFRTTGWAALFEDINRLRDKPIQLPAQPPIHELFKKLIQNCLVYDADKRYNILDVYYDLMNYPWKYSQVTPQSEEFPVVGKPGIRIKSHKSN